MPSSSAAAAAAARRTRNPPSLTPSAKTSSSLSPAPPSPAPRALPPTNIEVWNARRKRAEPDLDARADEARAVLKTHLAEMHKTHAYIVRSVLTAARLDLNARAPPVYDAVSPFADMRGIEMTPAEAKERKTETGRFVLRFHGKAMETKVLVSATAAETPKGLAPMPKYHSYTTLRNNILAEDDEVMRYFPYFGEDAEEDEISQLNLEETFVDRTKQTAEEGKKSEYAALYTTFLHPFLAAQALTLPAIACYLVGDTPRNEAHRRDALPDDFDADDAKVRTLRDALPPCTPDELDRAEPVCRAWKQETGISLWEVVKRADVTAKDGTRFKLEGSGKAAVEGSTGNPAPYSLESYAALNCLLCFMHECPFHVNKDHDRLSMAQAEDGAAKKDNTIILKLATNVPGWASMSRGSHQPPWPPTTPCSPACFLSPAPHPVPAPLTPAQTALLRSSATVLRNNPRCACLLSSIINHPCSTLHTHLLTTFPPTPHTPVPAPPPKPLKRKKPTSSLLPGYPPDCYLTHTHEKRTAFQACRHLDHCTDDCPCVLSRVTCEKSCICSPTCPRRWRGCSCKREGRACMKDSCLCVRANRECDVDLCHSCGAAEALDPVSRHSGRDGCQNVWLQRDMPKRTLLGRSAVAGFGLFMGEDVKNGVFLGEYKGEVITSDEADRRGKLYDKRGVSFLFNLNLNQVIDATRAGNKFRYVNHSGKRPNCGAKVLMAGCTHRIGMFAKRDLKAGEELFFDYGYNNKQVKFVQKEFEPPEFVAVVEPKKRGRRVARRRDLDYLKGGKGTTERSRARAAVVAGVAAAAAVAAVEVPVVPVVETVEVAEVGVKSAEYVRDSEEDSEEDLGQEDEGTEVEAEEEEEVDEEYEPETEESVVVDVVGVSAGETEEEEDEEDEPPRRPGGRGGVKRVRAR